ncbi:MAG: hypothetical protein HGB17_18960, partial [Syntrophobacteraceae bacterium]|nr:hypothetical protein [Syntrophobacteraceae bacterium]
MASWSGFKGLMMGLGAGALGGYFLGKALALRRSMPYIELWQKELEAPFGAVKAARLATRMQGRFEELFKSRPRLKAMGLRFHLEQAILPGLALYQVLQEELKDKDKALELTERLIQVSLEPLRDMMSKLDRFQDPFGSLRQVIRWSLSSILPAA